MKRLFPYLTPSNLKRLFASKPVEPGEYLGRGEGKTEASKAQELHGPLEINLAAVTPQSYQNLADLLKDATKMPFLMVCDIRGQVIWEDSERAFDIKAVQKDILTHLQQGEENDPGEFKKLVAYPKDAKGDPRDGVVRFGVVVPLIIHDDKIGALVACNDRETMMTTPLRHAFVRAARLLSEMLEVQSGRDQVEAEAATREEVQTFLNQGHGGAFLGMACKKLAKMLGAEWVFVLSADGPDDRDAQVVSAVFEGASVAPFSYDMAESPLRGLKGASVVFVGDKCREIYPGDSKVEEEGIAGYAAIGLPGTRKKLSGVLVAMSRRPFEKEGVIRVALETMAPRIAAELQVSHQLKEAESVQQRWQKRFEQFVTSDGVAVMITRPDGAIDSTNEALNRWLQYSSADLKQLVRRDLIVAGADEEEARWREECLAGKRPGYQRQVTVRRNDQQLIQSQLSVVAVPGDRDNEVWFIETLVDVEAEKVLQNQLREAEVEVRRLTTERSLLTRSLPLPLAQVDEKGCILEANGPWCDLLGFNLPEMKGVDLNSLCPEGGDHLNALLEKAAETAGTHDGGILEVSHASGELLKVSVWCGGTDPGGHQSGSGKVFVSFIDRSQQDKAEHSIREAMEAMEAIGRLPQQALAWFDASGQLIRATPDFEKVLQRDAASLRNLSLRDLFPEEEASLLQVEMERLKKSSTRAHSWSSQAVAGMAELHDIDFGLVWLPGDAGGQFLLGCRDRTPEVQARTEREIAQEHADTLMSGAPHGILLVDDQGAILSSNPAVASWMGKNNEGLKGSKVTGWLPSSLQETFSARLADEAGATLFTFESELRPPDSADALPVRWTGRQIRRVAGTGRPKDASTSKQWILFVENLGPEQEQSENLARLSSEVARYRLKAEALQAMQGAGILLVGMDEIVLEANQTFEKMAGTSVVGMELAECFDLDPDEQTFHQAVADCLTGKKDLAHLDLSLSGKRGTGNAGQLTLHTVRQPDGEIAYLVGLWQDTTEYSRLRRQWEKLDAPYRELLEQADAGFLTLDAEGKVSQVSGPVAAWAGLEAAEMTGRHFSAFLVSDGKVELEPILDADQFAGKFELKTSDAEDLPVQVDSRCFGEQGTPECWYLLWIRSRAKEVELEATARHWQEQYRKVFHRQDVAIARCDDRGQLLDVNPALLSLSGVQEEELLMRSWNDLMPEYEWNPAEVRERKAPLETEIQFSGDRKLAGRLYFQKCGAAPSGGTEYIVTMVDRSAENALKRHNRQLEARLDAILENPVIGVALLDESGSVTQCNDRFARFWEMQSDEAYGLEMESALPEEAAAEWSTAWQEMAAGQRSRFEVEYEQNDPVDSAGTGEEQDMAPRSARLTPILLDPDKDKAFALLFLEDLGDLARIRAELERTRQNLASVESQLASSRHEVSDLEGNKNDLLAQCSLLKSNLLEITTDRDGLRESKAGLETEQEKLNAELDQLRAELEAARQEDVRLNSNLQERENRLQELEAELASISEEKSRLDESLAAQEQALAEEKENLAAKEQELAALQSDRDSLDQTRLDNEKLIEERAHEKEELASEVSRVQDRLEETEQQRDSLLQDVMNSSPAALAVLDETGSLRQANRAFSELLESTPENLVGQDFDSLFQGRLQEIEQLAVRNVLEGRASTFDLELGVVTGDQVYRWLRVIGSRAPDHGVGGSQIFLVAEETTPVYEMENEKVASERRFLATAEIASVGLLLTGPDGDIFFANPAASRLLEKEGEDLIGQTVNTNAHPDDPREDLKCDQRMLAGEIDDYVVEKWLKKEDAPSRWLRMSVRAVRMDGGEFWYAVRILEDLTELRRTSEKLQQTEGKWDRIFQAADVAIAIMGRRGEVLQQNAGVSTILGARSEAEISKVLARMKGGDGHSFSLQYGKLVSGELSQFQIEDEVAGAGKEPVRIEVRVNPVFKPSGTFESAVAVIQSVKSNKTEDLQLDTRSGNEASDKPAEKPKPEAAASDSPEAARKQALKESVKISESQKINVEALKQIQAPARNRPKNPAPKLVPAPKEEKNGWLLADSNGTVLLVNQQARELLKMSPKQCLRKPLADVMHVKNQNSWHHPQGETDPEVANLTLMQTEVWDGENEVQKLVSASRSLMGSQGELLGTMVLLAAPPSEATDIQFNKTARSFLHTAEKIQSWSEKDLADLLLNADILNADDYAKEAERVEQAIPVTSDSLK